MRIDRRIVYPLAIAALAAALYAPTLGHPILWDDRMILIDGVALSGEHPFLNALTMPYLSTMNDTNYFQYYYRPASLLALAAERAAFGIEPLGYRAVHAALHVVNCLLVYALLALLLRRSRAGSCEPAAALGALAFAVAPYAVDSVLLLTNLGDELVLASLCAAVIAGFAHCDSGRWRHLAAGAAAGAVCVFSKESGACLPLLLALCLWLGGVPPRSSGFVRVVAAGSLLTVAMLLARFAALDAETPPVSAREAAARVFAGLGIAARYSVWPHPLPLEEEVSSAFGAWLGAGAIAVVALVAAVRFGLLGRRLVALGAAWWAVALLPSLLTVAVNQVFSARYLYVPSVGIACLLSFACAAAPRRRVACAAVAGLVVAWALFAAIRVFAWSDDLRLWSREVELQPERPTNLVRYASALSARGQGDRAEALLLRAGQLAHEKGETGLESRVRARECDILLGRGDREAALGECVEAIRIMPNNVNAWMTLGNLHAADGAWDKAYGSYEQAVERTPNAFRALISLAGAAAALGKRDVALDALSRAERMAAGSPERLADLRRRRGLVLDKLQEVEGRAR